MENLDTSTPKIKNDNDTSNAEMSNTGTPKRLNRKQRRDIKFRRGETFKQYGGYLQELKDEMKKYEQEYRQEQNNGDKRAED